MSLLWRARLMSCGAAVLALWLGMQIADGSYALPVLLAVLSVGVIAIHLSGVSIDAIALGALLFGYLVGNRGFAQLMPVPGIPLLPAELTLLVIGPWIGVRCALTRDLPFRRNALNWAILLWLVAGSIRVFFDVRPHGFTAVRDYAMVYYAVFFFAAQYLAGEPRAQRYLLAMVIGAAVLTPAAAIVSETFPGFLFSYLSVHGVPVILFKGDLAFTFTAVSAVLVALAVHQRNRWWVWPITSLEILVVIAGANRASMIGALAALGWLTFSRARRFVALQAGVIAAGVLLLAAAATLFENHWATQKFDALTERVLSLADLVGTGTYTTDESAMKADNNRFRTLWWQAVVDETLAENPVFGLGFGHDLARNFLQLYNPEIEDFTARSPHSIVVSVFGRMGVAGLAVVAVVSAVLTHATWRAIRNPASTAAVVGLWAAAWAILISACFGVVLEGPMGSVVFWSLLGLANAPSRATAESEKPSRGSALSLPQADARPEVTAI